MSYFGNNKQFNITSKGDSCFIRYSAHADGTNFTETWSEGQSYIGLATAQVAPTDKSGYVWCRAVGGKSAYDIACELENFKGTEQEWLDSLKGADGKTPYIEDGTWWIGETDTGVKAEGKDGVGISKIEKTATNGKIDTYTVTYTDNSTFAFTVTNGKDGTNGRGISSIEKTSTSGLVDTYTITYTDKTTATFTVTNGKEGTSVTIESVSESTVDGGENVVTFSDGKTLTVKNGKNGAEGKTPYVKNNTWWIGDIDTGIKAEGTDGKGINSFLKISTNGLVDTYRITYTDGTTTAIDVTNGKDGYTPIKGVDYYTEADKSEFSQYIASELAKRGQLKPEPAQTLADMTDTSLMYVLLDKTSPDNGYIFAYMLTEKEISSDGYKNWLPLATETYNGTTIYGGIGYVTDVRLSSSGSISTSDGKGMLATGFIPASDGARIRTDGFSTTGASMSSYVISYKKDGSKIAHKTWGTSDNYISDFTLDSATYGTEIAFIRISSYANASLPTIVTVNEEIKEGGTTIVKEYDWANTGHAFVPADYEDRIIELEAEVDDLNAEIETLNSKLEKANTAKLAISEVFAPSPQLPADGSETADFNGDKNYMTPEQIYAYIDALLNEFPKFITKEVMGKDASGTHDWCRYILSRRAYDAWREEKYPPMYAWVNGSTVIYSESVSPRIGDTLYTTKYIGTAKGTVTAVDNKNQSRTVGGVVYTRDKTKDVEPTLVYTETAYSPYFSTHYQGIKNGIYDSGKSKISTISTMADGTLTGANGVSYIRYPFGDRDSQFKAIPAIVIGGNEHGTGGDPATPAMINARMIKDLCECKNADNPFLNLLKNEYMMVFCPVVNPWGLHKDNQNYRNSNMVNLDRNFDTPGWVPTEEEPDGWNTGAYGGSESETQYFMNTLVASKCKVAMCNHSYGEGLDYSMPTENREAVSGGICSYMLGGERPQYTDALLKIAEVMASNYNLVFSKNSDTATPDKKAKTRSYMEWVGIDGIALEMNSREGFITDPNNEAQGKQFTARVMEAAYTQLLQVLYMLIDKQE